MSWDDIDQWAEEQRRKTPPSLSSGGECAETGKTISRDRARTQQAQLRIQRGFHPLGFRLRAEPGETCGTCAHLRVKQFAGRYFKCALARDTNGPATDVRKKWPACERFAATQQREAQGG